MIYTVESTISDRSKEDIITAITKMSGQVSTPAELVSDMWRVDAFVRKPAEEDQASFVDQPRPELLQTIRMPPTCDVARITDENGDLNLPGFVKHVLVPNHLVIRALSPSAMKIIAESELKWSRLEYKKNYFEYPYFADFLVKFDNDSSTVVMVGGADGRCATTTRWWWGL